MTSTALKASRSLTWVLDGVAMASLLAVPDVNPMIVVAIGSLFAVSRIGNRYFRFGEGVLTILLALISAATIVVILSTHVPTVVAIAHAAPIFHALLWFAPGGLRDLWLRVAVGFVELILASALTAEFYLPIAIFTFALASALMMSSSVFALVGTAGSEGGELPKSYLSRSGFQAVLVMLGGLALFPVLPRGQALGGVDFRQSRVGYTEDVSVTGEKQLTDSGSGAVVLRMYFADDHGSSDVGASLVTDIHLGLIRGRALSHFDGVNWSPASLLNRAPALSGGGGAVVPPVPRASGAADKVVNLELIREPMTEVLPLPYGIRNVWMFSGTGFSVPHRFRSGEWEDPGTAPFRVRYRAVLDMDYARLPVGAGLEDPPTNDNLSVPTALKSERMIKLVNRLLPEESGRTDSDRVRELAGFFSSGKFRVSDGNGADDEDEALVRDPAGSTPSSTWTSIERFIFVRKRGHCELFATAAAMLLRLAGIPTRLISGFRVSRFPSGGVLSVRSGDAHAWVEYWIPDVGWRPFDPTPRISAPFSLGSAFRDGYEWLSNYWYRYIFTFDGNSHGTVAGAAAPAMPHRIESVIERSTREFFAESRDFIIRAALITMALLLSTLTVAWNWFPWMFSIRARVRQGPRWLKTERIQMERLLARKLGTGDLETARVGVGMRFGPSAEAAYTEWVETYQRARFGDSECPGDRHKIFRPRLRSRRQSLKAAR